jgi:ATP synthase F1 complex assembly factor 2
LKRGQDLRAVAAGTGGGSAKTKRFWRDVHVKHADGMLLFPLSHQIPFLQFHISF